MNETVFITNANVAHQLNEEIEEIERIKRIEFPSHDESVRIFNQYDNLIAFLITAHHSAHDKAS